MKKTLLILTSVLIAANSYGQKIKVQSGSLNALKDVKIIKIEYDYSDLSVGDFEKEEDYIVKKVKELNEKEAGTGDSWKEKWFADREERYEPKFEELFTKYASSVTSGKNVESEIIMQVHTIFIEPGFNVGVMRKPAMINLVVTFFKGDEKLLELLVDKCPGSDAMGYDFDTGYRISEGYAKAGKSVAKYVF